MPTKRKPGGGRPRVFNIQQIVDLHHQGLNHCEISRQIGCSPSYVSNVLVKQGIRIGKGLGANPQSHINAQKVLDYIMTEGGSLRNAMLTLDLKVCDATIRTLAKKQGIDISAYRYFKQRRQNWEVYKPGFRKIGDMSHNFIPIQCLECGHQMELNYLNFNNASPSKCPSCGAG